LKQLTATEPLAVQNPANLLPRRFHTTPSTKVERRRFIAKHDSSSEGPAFPQPIDGFEILQLIWSGMVKIA
jgi:hypothetical protein